VLDERGSNFLIIIVIVIIDYRFHQELISVIQGPMAPSSLHGAEIRPCATFLNNFEVSATSSQSAYLEVSSMLWGLVLHRCAEGSISVARPRW